MDIIYTNQNIDIVDQECIELTSYVYTGWQSQGVASIHETITLELSTIFFFLSARQNEIAPVKSEHTVIM